MAILQPLFLENLDYSATDVRRLITAVLPTPGIRALGDLLVAQRAAGVNRSVDVAAGSAVIAGTDVAEQGNYLLTSDAVMNIPLAAAPGSGQSRIDIIVAQVLDQDADGGSSNLGEIAAVTGTAASTGSQVAPSAPASSLVLAQVLVGPSVTTITNSNITDERPLAIKGTLGYAQITANQPGVTTTVDITGLSVTVNVAAGRRLRVSAFCSLFGATAADVYGIIIAEVGGSDLQQMNVYGGSGGKAEVILTPSAGTHTYKVQGTHVSGSTGGTFYGLSSQPSFILVEDIGV